MAKNQVRLRAANGTIVRMSPEEAALAGSSYKPVGSESTDENTSTDITKLTVPQLKAYADEHGIELGAASKKKDILAVIAESDSDDDDDDEDDSDDE